MTDIIRFAVKQPTSDPDYSADDFLVTDYQAGFEEQPYSESTIAITESVIAIVGHVTQVDETIGITESNLAASEIVRTIDESIAITEEPITTQNLVRQVDELVTISETTQESLNIVPTPIQETVAITEQVLTVLAIPKKEQVDDVISIDEDVIVKLEHIEAPERWSSGISTKRKPKKYTVIRFENEIPEIEPLVTKIVESKLEIVYDILPSENLENKQYQKAHDTTTYTKPKHKPLPSNNLITPVPVVKVADTVKHVQQKQKSSKKPTFIVPVVTFPQKITEPEEKHLAIPVRQPAVYKEISAFLNAQYNIEEQKIMTVSASLECSYNIKDSRKYQQLLAMRRLVLVSDVTLDSIDI